MKFRNFLSGILTLMVISGNIDLRAQNMETK
jgi:hypothetical protein